MFGSSVVPDLLETINNVLAKSISFSRAFTWAGSALGFTPLPWLYWPLVGAMLLTWHGHGAYRARVETVEPPVMFAFRWVLRDREEPAPGCSTLVVMTLTPTDRGTHLRVVESGFAPL